MPYGISALSSHIFSQYRGPHIYNMADGDPPADPPKDTPPPPPSETESRISKLAEEKRELKAKLKEYEDAQTKASEEKLKEEGKLKELLESKEKSLAELSGLTESQKKALESYEKAAKAHVTAALEGIKDADKRKAVEKLLDGRSPAEQMELLPETLKLVGTAASFSGPTPPSDPPKAALEQKKARQKELLGKPQLTQQENFELFKLSTELGQEWEKAQKRE
jgi:hypothetical protein